MSWSDHIDNICTKARKSLGFIRRNLRNCPQYELDQAYASLVRPILEYACCALDPQQRKHIKQLESVPHRAARFNTGNYCSMKPGCVTNMVTHIGWDLLEHTSDKHRMNPGCVTNMVTHIGWDLLEHRITMFYKIINNLANIPVHHQLKVHNSSTRYSASHIFRQLNTKFNCCKYSF